MRTGPGASARRRRKRPTRSEPPHGGAPGPKWPSRPMGGSRAIGDHGLQPGQTGRPPKKGTTCRSRPMRSSPAPLSSATTDPTRHALRSRSRSTELSPRTRSRSYTRPRRPRTGWARPTTSAPSPRSTTRPSASSMRCGRSPSRSRRTSSSRCSRVRRRRSSSERRRCARPTRSSSVPAGSAGIRGALGSVSQELLRDAARPVLVVTRDAGAVRGAPALASW